MSGQRVSAPLYTERYFPLIPVEGQWKQWKDEVSNVAYAPTVFI